MRGKVLFCIGGRFLARITPAHAGKSLRHKVIIHIVEDHPRACGEKIRPAFPSGQDKGSPPRMRGKVPQDAANVAGPGITPAHAGKRYPCIFCFFVNWDHPRACGEKAGSRLWRRELIGSPPRMRGKVICMVSVSGLNGITPAHAGKSSCQCVFQSGCRDHPRACGEKKIIQNCFNIDLGSPPRMRGKAQKDPAELLAERITPAHAGKSDVRFECGESR